MVHVLDCATMPVLVAQVVPVARDVRVALVAVAVVRVALVVVVVVRAVVVGIVAVAVGFGNIKNRTLLMTV
jgi:hypothetical protein